MRFGGVVGDSYIGQNRAPPASLAFLCPSIPCRTPELLRPRFVAGRSKPSQQSKEQTAAVMSVRQLLERGFEMVK